MNMQRSLVTWLCSLFLVCIAEKTLHISSNILKKIICSYIFFFQLTSLEEALAGALRRESTAENTIRELEAEIEKLNELVTLF